MQWTHLKSFNSTRVKFDHAHVRCHVTPLSFYTRSLQTSLLLILRHILVLPSGSVVAVISITN